MTGGVLFLALSLLSAHVERVVVFLFSSSFLASSCFGGDGDGGKKKDWCYNPHQLRDSLSRVCMIFKDTFTKDDSETESN